MLAYTPVHDSADLFILRERLVMDPESAFLAPDGRFLPRAAFMYVSAPGALDHYARRVLGRVRMVHGFPTVRQMFIQSLDILR